MTTITISSITKKASSIIVAGLLFTLSVMGQQPGDSKIIITTDKAHNDNFVSAGRILAQNGFQIQNSNESFGTIQTKALEYSYKESWPSKKYSVVVNVLVKDKEIHLTSSCKSTGGKWRNTIFDEKKDLELKTFRFVEEIAKGLGKVSYSK